MRQGFFILIFFITVFTIDLLACECISPQNPKIQFQKSDFVFTGKVLKTEPSNNFHGIPVFHVTFKVLKSYKGLKDGSFKVSTNRNDETCGIPFKENSEYLVYASSLNGVVVANSCGGTRDLSHELQLNSSSVKEELKLLDMISSASPQNGAKKKEDIKKK